MSEKIREMEVELTLSLLEQIRKHARNLRNEGLSVEDTAHHLMMLLCVLTDEAIELITSEKDKKLKLLNIIHETLSDTITAWSN